MDAWPPPNRGPVLDKISLGGDPFLPELLVDPTTTNASKSPRSVKLSHRLINRIVSPFCFVFYFRPESIQFVFCVPTKSRDLYRFELNWS